MIAARTQPSLPPPEREEGSVTRAAPAGGGARPRLLILTVGFGIGGAEQLILTTAPRGLPCWPSRRRPSVG